MKYTLNKSLLSGSSLPNYLYDDKYLTNGSFLIERELVKECYKYLSPNGAEENGRFDKILNVETPTTFFKTSVLIQVGKKSFARLFVDGKNEKFLLDEKYVTNFNLSSVDGKDDKNPCITHDKIIFMPMRLPEWLSLLDVSKVDFL